jgi:hypothetical protein
MWNFVSRRFLESMRAGSTPCQDLGGKLSAVLNTPHVVKPEAFGYSDERYYDVISDLVVRRTADLKYFSDDSGEFWATLSDRPSPT